MFGRELQSKFMAPAGKRLHLCTHLFLIQAVAAFQLSSYLHLQDSSTCPSVLTRASIDYMFCILWARFYLKLDEDPSLRGFSLHMKQLTDIQKIMQWKWYLHVNLSIFPALKKKMCHKVGVDIDYIYLVLKVTSKSRIYLLWCLVYFNPYYLLDLKNILS